MKKGIHVYSIFNHGFAVFTIMENQSNTEWGWAIPENIHTYSTTQN